MKKLKQTISTLILATFVLSCTKPEKKETTGYNEKLWYTYPAKYWNSQALHLGNGHFGVSFYGGVEREEFTLSDKSIWTGGPFRGNWEEIGINPKAKDALPEIREAITSGRIAEADKMVIGKFLGKNQRFGNFSGLGSMIINFEGLVSECDNYKRELDLSRAIGKVSFEKNGVEYKREYFCSYPDRVMAMKLSSSVKEMLSFSIGFEMMQDSFEIVVNENSIVLSGHIKDNGRPFQVDIRVENTGGEVVSESDFFEVKNADEAIVYLSIATNYKLEYPEYLGEDPGTITQQAVSLAQQKGYDHLKEDHIADYQSVYQRSSVSFAGNPDIEKLPTNQRYESLKNGNPDPGYKELAFNLGKYMVISASRPGTLPANLQGTWNNFYSAPWAGNYQSNINIQEIYWPCGPANMPECHEPWLDWIADLVEPGREVAKRVYGTNGWVSHTTGNIWGHAAPIGGISWGTYPVGAAWHCQHIWDQYAFTQDMDYLKKRAYPIMKEASVFWLENLVEYAGGLIIAPTVSAEHGAAIINGKLNPAFHDNRPDEYVYNIPGAFQDVQMIWDLFTNTAEAADLTGDHAFADKVMAARDKLQPLKTGKHGQLQEWYQDIDHPDCHHRHIAHMYAVCPGTQIHPTTTPELAEAAKKSLNMRGDGRFMEQEFVSGGNWSRAHRMCTWVRLMDGNRANKIMTEKLTEEGFENLLTFQHIGYHWERPEHYKENDSTFCHFQLDATGATTAAIAEMILQSHMGEIHLLPAIPNELKTGEAAGFLARGGYEIDVEWKDGELVEAVIISKKGKKPVVRVKDKVVDIQKDKRIEIITE